jgi:hypothetical protein
VKIAKSNYFDVQPLQQVPFKHLLPVIPEGGLTPDHLQTLAARLANHTSHDLPPGWDEAKLRTNEL